MPYIPSGDVLAPTNNRDLQIFPGLKIHCTGYIAGFHLYVSGYHPVQSDSRIYIGIWRDGKAIDDMEIHFVNWMNDTNLGDYMMTYSFPDERVRVVAGDYISVHVDDHTDGSYHPLIARGHIRTYSDSYTDYLRQPVDCHESSSTVGSSDWDQIIGSKYIPDSDDGDWSSVPPYLLIHSDSMPTDYSAQQLALQAIIVENREGK